MDPVTESVEPKYPSRRGDLPDEAYRKVGAISQSVLKNILASPLHFYHEITHPSPPTDAQMLGLAVHHELLGCHGDSPLVLRPDDMSPYTKDGKAWKAEQLAKKRVIVERGDLERIANMKESLHQDPEIAAALTGEKEVSCFAELQVPENELVQCKCRLDLLPHRSDTVVDLKTCRAGSLYALGSDIAKYRYHFQAFHYLKMYEATRGEADQIRDKFLFIFVESEPPHATRKVMLSNRWMMQAENDWIEAMTRLIECRRTGEWPGYGREIFVLNPPSRDDMRYVEEIME